MSDLSHIFLSQMDLILAMLLCSQILAYYEYSIIKTYRNYDQNYENKTQATVNNPSLTVFTQCMGDLEMCKTVVFVLNKIQNDLLNLQCLLE